jgi:amino acid transporter
LVSENYDDFIGFPSILNQESVTTVDSHGVIMAEKKIFARPASGLVRAVSAWDALIYNVVFMAPTAIFVYGFFGLSLFPGIDLPTTALMSIPIGIVIGLFYALYSAAMPRSGGDYIWVSRVLHPVLGFMNNVALFIILLGIAGSYMPWFTQWGMAPILQALGQANAAALVSSTNFTFAWAILFWVICAMIISRGVKATHYAFWIFFVLILIGIGAYIGTLFTTNPTQFAANFNAQSGMNYNQVIQTAQKAGIPSGFVTSATLLGVAYTYLNFIGFNASVYYAGEIKEVRKSQFIAIIGSVVVFGLITWLLYEATYVGMGSQFVDAMAYLATVGDPSYKLSLPPLFHILFQYATNNPTVFILAVFAFSMMTLSSSLTYLFIGVRFIFAWSFDRVVPTALAKIDRKHNSPYMALIAVTVTAIILQALWSFTPVLNYFAYAVLGFMMIQAIVAISGAWFPWRRKDIFDVSPSVTKTKLGPVPLITVLGVVTFFLSVWLGYASISPAYVGALNPLTVAFTLGLFVIGIVIYAISSAYHKSKGIPLELSFRELPPE